MDNTITIRAIAMATVVAISVTMVACIPKNAPGHAPNATFVEHGVMYSADGCWRQQGGFWHPLRRCHIVRLTEEQFQARRGLGEEGGPPNRTQEPGGAPPTTTSVAEPAKAGVLCK